MNMRKLVKIKNLRLIEAKQDDENFLQWLVKGYEEELGITIETSLDIANANLERFKKYKAENRIKGEESDYYYWMKGSLQEFSDFMGKIENKVSVTQQKKDAREGAVLVGENKIWRVYKINTHEAAMQYGKHTQWCITEEDGGHWRNYTERDKFEFWYFIKKEPKGNEKDKIAVAKNEFNTLIYNAEDNTIDYITEAPIIKGLENVVRNYGAIVEDNGAMYIGLTLVGGVDSRVAKEPGRLEIKGRNYCCRRECF